MLLFFVYFILLFFITNLNFSKNLKELFLHTTLIFSAIIVFITEFLSLFHAINLITVGSFWIILSIVLLFFLVKDKNATIENLKNLKSIVITIYKSLKIYEKGLLIVIVLMILALFYQGIIYPPNNWDSLTYHLSRIMYWLGNGSVAHFPTHILRHLYQPPFAEYCIMHINLLNGNDYLSNSLQLCFLMFSIIAIWANLDYFNAAKFHNLLAAFLLITIPSVELQATTTKNDIVCGFFILTTLYFAIKTYYELTLKNLIFLGLAIGLGMLTKGTAYLFMLPILLLFAGFMIFKLIKTKDLNIIKFGLFAITLILLINVGHFSRNYKINGNVLNIDENEQKMYSNSEMDGLLLCSNILKNIGLHVGYPMQYDYDNWIRNFHDNNDMNIDNPATNFAALPYHGPKEFETHEDLVSNNIHLYLIGFFVISVLLFGFLNPKKNYKELLILFIIATQIIIFAGFLKWQPWHTRLHIPIFILGVLLITVGAKQFKYLMIIPSVSIYFLINSFYFNYVYNSLRPIKTKLEYTKNVNINDERFKKYFANQPQLFDDYSAIVDKLDADNPQKIGFTLLDWEYPLISYFYYQKIELVAINVGNITNTIPQDNSNIDALILNTNTPYFVFEGKKYINKTPENKYIWYYRSQILN
jgi:Dolichyl-phosphate-mannose-protein mannosyltransferase